jgi:ankyrin repeat protein
MTALIIASQNGPVQASLAKGAAVNANVDSKNGLNGNAVMVASFNGHLAVVKELVSKGADVNAKTKDGWTELKIASKQGHLKIVELLKKAGTRDY